MEGRAAKCFESGQDGSGTFIKELAWREFYLAMPGMPGTETEVSNNNLNINRSRAPPVRGRVA